MEVELAADHRSDLNRLSRVARERRNFLSDGLAHAVGNHEPRRDSFLQAGAPISEQQSQGLIEKKWIAFGNVAQSRNQSVIGRQNGAVLRECCNFRRAESAAVDSAAFASDRAQKIRMLSR